jgi:hypothetical protein
MLQPLQRRLHAQRLALNRFHRRLLLGREDDCALRVGLVELIEVLAHAGNKEFGVDARAHRDCERAQHACHRRMHARLEHEVPQSQAHDEVNQRVAHAQPIHGNHRAPEQERIEQRVHLEVLRVEYGNHQHRAEVVHDGKRGQEHLERERRACAQQRECAQREGDVSRHRDAPAANFRRAPVQRNINQRRHNHPAHRRCHRQRRLARGTQLAHQQLALNLHPHQKEEHRHQAVVNPQQQRLVDIDKVAEAHLHGGRPEPKVVFAQRRVRPEQGNYRARQQHDAPCARLLGKQREGL